MLHNFLFTLNLVLPVFFLVILGTALNRWHIIDDHFSKNSSKLVFNVALPTLVFLKLSQTDISSVIDWGLIAYAYLTTILFVAVVWGISAYAFHTATTRASFIQGVYRSNYAIIGLTIIMGMYGDQAFAKGAFILAFIIPLYNLIAVVLMESMVGQKKGYLNGLLAVAKNPLIWGALLGLGWSLSGWNLPKLVITTGHYLAAITLPLALLSIGSTLNWASLRKCGNVTVIATVVKLVIYPLIFTSIAVAMGYRDDNLAVLYLLYASPTAVASYIMAQAMGANARIAGNIVLATTLASVFTLTIGLFILRQLGLI
ncbi:AEC family transporter [bacterium]|jgi:malonate transporter and related proteins|nr:AEC family transporter [bacterium]